jgi:hypothetical protein
MHCPLEHMRVHISVHISVHILVHILVHISVHILDHISGPCSDEHFANTSHERQCTGSARAKYSAVVLRVLRRVPWWSFECCSLDI